MPTQLYETLFLLDNNKMATDADNIRGSLQMTIEKYGAEVLIARHWDDRKIAYPIRRAGVTHKKGSYYIMYYKMESTKQIELDKDFRLNMTEFLIRHMTSNIDARWAEPMLEVARNDQGNAFALKCMRDDSSPTDLNPSMINDPLAADFIPPMEGTGHSSGGGRRRREKPE
jgi:small subunit ribosomal protein S6